LIELYTSEGCSSCPPADRWLSSLVDHPQLWSSFIPVSMHFTYWDYIGWQDPFASPRNDRRQRFYKAQKHSASVYTPGFFVAGDEWRGWFRQPDLNLSYEKVGKLRLELNSEQALLKFQPLTHANNNSSSLGTKAEISTAHLILLGFGLSSEVRSGENRGEVLKHNFVALDHQIRTQHDDTAPNQWQFKPFDLPAAQAANMRLAIVAWVQRGNDIRPIQAVGGWLPE
jgi:hypothetical protein